MVKSQRRKASGRQPISRHPLFPATVALWFGALFGLGSMAIPSSLIEQIVLAIGLETFIPATQPPLGATTQILTALAAACSGGILGLLLARRIAQSRAPAPQGRRGGVESIGFGQRALSNDEDGWPGTSPSPPRRPAMPRDDARRDYHDRAPIPAGSPQILKVFEFDRGSFDTERRGAIQDHVPEADEAAKSEADFAAIEGSDEARNSERPHADLDTDAPYEGDMDATEHVTSVDLPANEPQIVESAIGSMAETEWTDDAANTQAADETANSEVDVETEEADGSFDRPFVSDDQHERPVTYAYEAVAAVDRDDPLDNAWERDSGNDPSEQASDRKSHALILSAKLNELSHAELLERLALNMERRRRQAADPNADAGRPVRNDDEPEQLVAVPFANEISFVSPPEDRGPAAAPVCCEENDDPAASEGEERRLDQPECARLAPRDDAAAPQNMDSDEPERSLRAALASLQRMRGAA